MEQKEECSHVATNRQTGENSIAVKLIHGFKDLVCKVLKVL